MDLLPLWVLTDTHPAFYDSESATALEQTAKIYGAMNQLISEYNSFVDSTNEKIKKFIEKTEEDYEIFKVSMRQEFQDFIDVIDLKIKEQDDIIKKFNEDAKKEYDNFTNSVLGLIKNQDKIIADAVDYMKNNITATTTDIINESIRNGKISIEFIYDSETESLNITASGGV